MSKKLGKKFRKFYEKYTSFWVTLDFFLERRHILVTYPLSSIVRVALSHWYSKYFKYIIKIKLQEKTGCEEVLDQQKKQLTSQHEQLHNLNKSLSLNLSAKKEYSEF